MPLLILLGFVAGLATALAPCVLPVLPIVVAGSVTGGRLRPLGIAVGVAGSFTVFTLALSALLRGSGLSPGLVRDAAVIGLIVFGLALLVPRLDHRLARSLAPVARLSDALPRGGDGFPGGVLLGGALGLAWTPCAGPILAGLTAAIATVGATGEVALVLAAYAVGAAVPLALIGWGGRRLTARLGSGARALRPAMGALMVLSGLVILAGLDTRLTAAALADVPGYDGIQALERVDATRDGLARIQGLPEGAPPLVAAARGADPDPADALGLPNAGPAPELRGISAWFNTARPLVLADLRGSVVLLDFWTYSCVNCVRTLPHLRAWRERYADAGLVIVGVHTPEFAFEAEPGNVRRAIADLDVPYPVALDPEYATWNAYRNQYWPAKYLIDRDGDVRDLHVGEGGYDQTELLIRRLLGRADPERGAPGEEAEEVAGHGGRTPESYLGWRRLDRFAGPVPPSPEREVVYRPPRDLPADALAFQGAITLRAEFAQAGAGGRIHLDALARDVFLVMASPGRPRRVEVRVDGRPIAPRAAGDDVRAGTVEVRASRLYGLARFSGPVRRHRLELRLEPGVRAYAFTFG